MVGITGNGGYIEYAMTEWRNLLEVDHRNSHEAFEEGISDEEYVKLKAVMDMFSEDVKRFELGWILRAIRCGGILCPPAEIREDLEAAESGCRAHAV